MRYLRSRAASVVRFRSPAADFDIVVAWIFIAAVVGEVSELLMGTKLLNTKFSYIEIFRISG